MKVFVTLLLINYEVLCFNDTQGFAMENFYKVIDEVFLQIFVSFKT